MLVTDIETYLNSFGAYVSNSVTFTVRRGFLPATPDAVIALEEALGLREIRAMGPSLSAPLFERPVLQVTTRSPRQDYIAGRSIAETVHQRLSGAGGLTLTGRRYSYIQALSPPFLERQDDEGRFRFVANYVVHKERG